ncbi:MAG: WG repeat-containing protein, partial [Daejeonella sp.]
MYRKYIVFSSLFVFISIRLFAQELIPFTNELKKMGYKNSKGAVVIAAQYDYAEAFYEGLAKIKALNKYGFINPAGKLIIAPQYDDAERFCNGLAVVNKGGPFSGKWGYINKEGKEIVPLTYSFTTSFSEGLGCVMKDRKYGYVDTTGKVVIPVSYLEANAFSEGVAVVFKGTEQLAPGIVQRMIKTGKYGYINKKGETVLPFNYTKAGDFKNGIAQVAINETAFFTNKQGEVTDKNGNKISSANSIKESLPAVKITSFRKDGKEGLMAKGIEIVPPVYEYTDGGDYGIGLVKKGYMSYFLVDYTGRKITDLDGITSAGSFKNGEGYATKAGKWGIIDTAGKWIVPPVYNHVSNFADGFAIAQDSANDYRIINRDNETIACCFYAIKGFKKGWWTVKRGYTDVNYVNKKGEVLFEMEVQEELLENPYNPNFINGVCSIKLGFEGDKP